MNMLSQQSVWNIYVTMISENCKTISNSENNYMKLKALLLLLTHYQVLKKDVQKDSPMWSFNYR